jgi:hypothetical protein
MEFPQAELGLDPCMTKFRDSCPMTVSCGFSSTGHFHLHVHPMVDDLGTGLRSQALAKRIVSSRTGVVKQQT